MPWAKRTSKPIPNIGSRSRVYGVNDYSLGMNSFVSNDKMPLKDGEPNLWRLAQDARITTLGEYETRKGFDFYSDAAGKTQDQTITSTTGASDASFSTTSRLAQKWTAGANGSIVEYDLNLKNDAGATGTVIVEHWSDSAGAPGEMMSRTSIAASSVLSSYSYLSARFARPMPVVSGTSYWIVCYVQATGSGMYKWSSTTSATTSSSSSDSGVTWSANSYALNFKQYYATTGGVKGIFRATKSDGTKVTLLAQGTTLYTVNDSTGALTAIKTGLSASATNYRFVAVNDVIYYVNGFDGLRKWDYTTESQITAVNYTLLCVHKGLLFRVPKDDPNKIEFSNFGEYEVFTSTDFIYVPSPKTGDPIVALKSLNGYLIMPTRDDKYILSGDDNATFSLDNAPDKKGTYSQETIDSDKNFIYYLSDDGVYRSNGSEPQLISEANYDAIVSMPNKESACICVNRGRLYLWYRSSGSAYNDSCYVWNLNYGKGSSDCLESLDTGAYVSRAINSPNDNDSLIVGSSIVGRVLWQELDSNDYNNLGDDINFELDTNYITFSSPASKKEIRYWKPRFSAQGGNYTVSCEYATDLRNNWQVYQDVNVQGSGYIWGALTTLWGSFTWGTTAEIEADLYVPGEYKRIALRYKHHATRQPINFLGHTLSVQVRRMR